MQTPNAQGNWTEASDRIADVVEENIALGKDWNEGLLLVSGVPVAVREEVCSDATTLVYPKVEGYLRWRLRNVYGEHLRAKDGDAASELLDHAMESAMQDLASNWLRKDRNLTLFLRDPYEALGLAKGHAWKRAEQELNRELDRQQQGTGKAGDLRSPADPWRAYTGQRSYSARVSRSAERCYFEQEDERSRRSGGSVNELRERLREPEPERVVPRGRRESVPVHESA